MRKGRYLGTVKGSQSPCADEAVPLHLTTCKYTSFTASLTLFLVGCQLYVVALSMLHLLAKNMSFLSHLAGLDAPNDGLQTSTSLMLSSLQKLHLNFIG